MSQKKKIENEFKNSKLYPLGKDNFQTKSITYAQENKHINERERNIFGISASKRRKNKNELGKIFHVGSGDDNKRSLKKECRHNLRADNKYFQRHFTHETEEKNSPKNEKTIVNVDKIKKRKNEFLKSDSNFVFNEKLPNQLKSEGSARTRGFYSPRKKKIECETKKNSPNNYKITELPKNYSSNQRQTLQFEKLQESRKNLQRKPKCEISFSNNRYLYSTSTDSIRSFDLKTGKIKEQNVSKQGNFCFNEKYSLGEISNDFSKCGKKSNLNKKGKDLLETTSKNKNISSKKSDLKNEEKEENQIITNRSCENSNHNNKTCQFMNFIRKLIIDEDYKNVNSKNKTTKMDSSVKIKKTKKVSSCESSGYDSLKSVHNNDSTKEKVSKANFSKTTKTNESNSDLKNGEKISKYSGIEDLKDNIQFHDLKNFSLYKIFRSSDGGILLKESLSVEFNKSGYVIGKRISKKLEFSEKDQFLKNSSCKLLRNSSTQTEFIERKKFARKQNWFQKKNYIKRKQRRGRKYATVFESTTTSNSSVPETTDCEHFNSSLLLKKKSNFSEKKYFPPNSMKFTGDLNYASNFLKIPENKIIILFNSSSEIEKKLLNFEEEKTKVNHQKEIQTFGTNLLVEKCKVDLSEKNYFYTNLASVMVPISLLNLENSEVPSKKEETKFNELLEVKGENCDNIEKMEVGISSEQKIVIDDQITVKKKKSKTRFRIFKKKKK